MSTPKVDKSILDIGTGPDQIPQNDPSGDLDADTLGGLIVGIGPNQIPVRDGLGDLDADTLEGNVSADFAVVGHTHTNLPSSDEKAALVGTDGTPSAANPFVTDSDPRISAGAEVVSGGTKVQSGKTTSSSSITGTVTFPTPFASTPVVIAVVEYVSGGIPGTYIVNVHSVSSVGFDWSTNTSGVTKIVAWAAIGT